jgi:hypothetical protein
MMAGPALLAGAGCAGPGEDPETRAADGSLRGELAIYIADDPGVGSQTHYFLKDAAGTEQRLLFDADPGLAPGAPLTVWGAPQGQALRVSSFERGPAPATPTIQAALIGAQPFPARTFAFVLIDIGGGVNRTTDDVLARMIEAPDSIRNYYMYASYGMQDITAKVLGPISYTPTECDTSAMTRALRSQVDADGGPFQHYIWYLGSKNDACAWSGLASVGTPDAPTRDTWYNASTSCIVLIQEPGHNFGMQHSSSLACGSATFADDPNTCISNEYGDRFDPMGGGCRHMNAWQKDYQGWFGGCNGVKVTDSGTFTLVPFEQSCTGVQYLQVKAPKARPYLRPMGGGGPATTENLDYYYLELRTPLDFDGTLGNSSGLSARVLLHVAEDRHSRTQRGVHTYLLDMNPATTGTQGLNDAGLAAGETFTDPAGGLTITAQSVSNSGATIVVSYASGSGGGSPTCIDGSAFTPPGPGMESCQTTVFPGSGGSLGTTGRGGASGASGAGGTTGAAGAGGATGGSAPAESGLSKGCACDLSPSDAKLPTVLLVALGLAVVGRRRLARPRRVDDPRW